MNVHAPFYDSYVSRTAETGIVPAMKENLLAFEELFSGVDNAKAAYRYADGKWSIRELVGHLIDTERVFGYRAMSIARGEKKDLIGFDEDQYVSSSNAHERGIESLLEEFRAVRMSTIMLFQSFSDNHFNLLGSMNGDKASVQSIGRIVIGHCKHHMEVISDRYLD